MFYILTEVSAVSGYENYYNTKLVEVMKEKDPAGLTLVNEGYYDQLLEEAARYREEVKAEWPEPEIFKLGSYKFGFYLMIIVCAVNLFLAFLLMKQQK